MSLNSVNNSTPSSAHTLIEHVESFGFIFSLGKHLLQSACQTVYTDVRSKFLGKSYEAYEMIKVRKLVQGLFSQGINSRTLDENALWVFNLLNVDITTNFDENHFAVCHQRNQLPFQVHSCNSQNADLTYDDLFWMASHHLGIRQKALGSHLTEGYFGDSCSLASSWAYLYTALEQLVPSSDNRFKKNNPKKYFATQLAELNPKAAEAVKDELTSQYNKAIKSFIQDRLTKEPSPLDRYFFITYNDRHSPIGGAGGYASAAYEFGNYSLGKVGKFRKFASEVVAVIYPKNADDPVESTWQAFLHIIKSQIFRGQMEGFTADLYHKTKVADTIVEHVKAVSFVLRLGADLSIAATKGLLSEIQAHKRAMTARKTVSDLFNNHQMKSKQLVEGVLFCDEFFYSNHFNDDVWQKENITLCMTKNGIPFEASLSNDQVYQLNYNNLRLMANLGLALSNGIHSISLASSRNYLLLALNPLGEKPHQKCSAGFYFDDKLEEMHSREAEAIKTEVVAQYRKAIQAFIQDSAQLSLTFNNMPLASLEFDRSPLGLFGNETFSVTLATFKKDHPSKMWQSFLGVINSDSDKISSFFSDLSGQ